MTVPPIDRAQADRFLSLLGKSPATTRLRAFPHRLNPSRADIGARKGTYNLSTAQKWQADGRGVYVVVNNGGDRADQIISCPAVFVEWDNRPIEWQLVAWKSLGFGEPSIIVLTGGKSAHCYWLLDEPITPEQWAPLQAALIAAAGADPACKDSSRVMRLPGAHYIGPQGTATGQTIIHAAPGHRYSVATIQSWLARHTTQQPSDRPAPQPNDLPPRPPEALHDAIRKIPPFSHGAGQYDQLLGLAMRLHVEIGARAAEQLLAETCCSALKDLHSYFTTEVREYSPGSIWPYLRDQWGIDISRRDLKGTKLPKTSKGTTQPAAAPSRDIKPPPLTLDEVRERLRYAIEGGASRQDLEALRIELAAASELQAIALRDLTIAIQREHEATCSVQQEAASIRASVNRQETGSALTLDYLLPSNLAEALRIRTQSLPADDVAACMALLVAISGVVKLGSEVVAAEALDFRTPLNLYSALVARSGAKKSPLSRLLVDKPTRELRIELAKQHTRELINWQESNRGVKPADRPEPPRASYLQVSDFTAEALAMQLQVQEARGLGLLLHRDELAGLFGSMNAYRKGRGGDEEQLLEAYDGSGFQSLRVAATGGGRFYGRCHLSVWGTIQPAILEALVANGDASGLWARFIFVPLPDVVVPLPESETDLERQRARWAEDTLAAACRFVYSQPRTSLHLSPDGRRAFVAYEAGCQQEVRRTTIPAQGALWGKSPGKVLRIAGLLHMAHLSAGTAEGGLIDAEAVGRACMLVDHLNAWTLSLHQQVAEGGTSDLMQLVHRVAQAANGVIAWRHVSQRLSKVQRKDVDSAAVAAAMKALADLGVGVAESGPRGGMTYTATADLP
jgi:hypothetical protein